ncbi:RNA polymerase sigma factor [Echinimonas agarilytica]|uniref:Sigma-70 family RNA polymerase sigma factor n=1 Tax=Echinimonas agarilytica TaxID=1215918 RepID=A0AA41W7S9_9GAMM|nr:sigma-70 family RNA polymerase sigma factor [Echinimonas agarilytica]MCM2680341.1 sigma-70 family RNA polymerase sigma factor [Echinimonas agarilytica]
MNIELIRKIENSHTLHNSVLPYFNSLGAAVIAPRQHSYFLAMNNSITSKLKSISVDDGAASDQFSNTSLELASRIPQIRNFIASKVPDRQEVDDLVQDTICKTLSASIKTDLSNPLAYAIQVAKSNIVEHWKKQSVPHVEIEDDMSVTVKSPESLHLSEMRSAAVLNIIGDMPELRRSIFMKRRVEGWSRNQIASEFSVSVEVVKKHLTRAMVTLTLELEKLDLVEEDGK